MKRFMKTLAASAIVLSSTTLNAAPPSQLVTDNQTQYVAYAFINNKLPVMGGTPAHTKNPRPWQAVRNACSYSSPCTAVIKMQINNKTFVEVGNITLNLETGDVTPSTITGHGFTINIVKDQSQVIATIIGNYSGIR